MPRNLDLTALRSFVAVADTGGVTKASGFLNLTQSAVSMQLKRLEESLGASLFNRSARSLALTGAGDQLLGYARRMIELNDEVIGRMSDSAFEGELVLGVPHDIVYPAIPRVLQAFASEFPRMRVNLVSSFTRNLKAMFARGECDFILTTEDGCDPGGETLIRRPLVWVGAPGGAAWRGRPVRVAFGAHCIFRSGALRALDAADIAWELAVESDSDRAIEAIVSADLAIHAMIAGSEPPHTEVIAHGGALPDLGQQRINLYMSDLARGEVPQRFAELVRQHYLLA
ncbi:LysR family transcriptional regulator [Mesobaculum littorinae]|uniref:LysR family transcriptional regulator n=1 Tax=Mesobaculum littorinae TaxID=2486419 RepID=A0A438AE43_9RHOB|nr:LysR family transcriptional regulator [Mesobaculum littorinae]RVV96922.1 LysR family transcriptional regulator [Mesobaculum littorinae]